MVSAIRLGADHRKGKPVSTLIFGGVAALASALREVAKHL
jgi:hypothetical protein